MIKKEEVADNPLTPDQLQQLAQIYRLILSWRRTHLSTQETPLQSDPNENSAQTEQINGNEGEI
jgi:hypothetical protein